VPAVVFAQGGDLTYLQLGIGAILARLIVGLIFVRAFYEREIYSPYDYVGARLGAPARTATTWLFVLGAVLGQSVRVLLTAKILELISGIPMSGSIWLIGAFAAGWTLLGGITTVIWTDVIQFFVFLLAMAAGLGFVLHTLPGGWAELWQTAAASGKTRLWNLTTDPSVAFTLWAALVGNTVMCLGAFGTDQMMAQRMFCCRGPRQATYAIIASSVGQLVAVLAALVGLGLFAFYQRPDHALTGGALALATESKDSIFPYFILTEMPTGLVGLIIAGIFAAAISSLDSALAALAQTVVTGIYRPWRERTVHPGGDAPADERHYLRVSKVLVVVWALVLSGMAQVSLLALDRYGDILNLALAMATYTWGALLAAFLVALLRVPVDHRGVVWGAPLSVLAVFAVTWHQPWAHVVTAAVGGAVTLGWFIGVCCQPMDSPGDRRRAWLGLTVVAATAAAAFGACAYRDATGQPLRLAWPWSVPIGLAVAFALACLLGRPRSEHTAT
jgi:Na+/proline symporter